MDIFCKIINNEIPSYKLYEDDEVLCFLDINPDTNGHALIIPKKHYTDINDIDFDVLTHIFEVAKEIKKLLDDKLHIYGLTFIQNNGDVQEVKHFHLHLKPYYNKMENKLEVKDVYEILTKKDL